MDTIEAQLAIADYMRWLRIFGSADSTAGRTTRSRLRTLREGKYAAKLAGRHFARLVALKGDVTDEASPAGAEPASNA